jgi:23S rRNA pseudouridine2605 synthase
VYLTKYIAYAGFCSRRKALELVKQGQVLINGQVQINPAYDVQPSDQVQCAGKPLVVIQERVYVLLNQPVDCVSSCADIRGRTTVLDYVKDCTASRLYPIGRLDQQTTGVLLLTNDGQLAYTLSHPRFGVPKIYTVVLDKSFNDSDAARLRTGITLDDGFIAVDNLTWDIRKPLQVIVELHSGRNRIVRRMFAHLGYKVEQLDRIAFARLEYKGLTQGQWRLLTEVEVKYLRLFGVPNDTLELL